MLNYTLQSIVQYAAHNEKEHLTLVEPTFHQKLALLSDCLQPILNTYSVRHEESGKMLGMRHITSNATIVVNATFRFLLPK